MIDAINRTARRIPAWSIYALAAAYIGWMIASAVLGLSGPDPVKALERGFGERGLQVLIAALCITPLRWGGVNLVKFRRAIGLVGFALIGLHFLSWITLDMGLRWSEITNDLLKRPYIIIGFAAFLALLPMAITSNNGSIRRMGAAAWKRLHWLAYPATLAGAVHFVMIGKVYTVESALYVGAVGLLLAARWLKSRKPALRTA